MDQAQPFAVAENANRQCPHLEPCLLMIAKYAYTEKGKKEQATDGIMRFHVKLLSIERFQRNSC